MCYFSDVSGSDVKLLSSILLLVLFHDKGLMDETAHSTEFML